MNRIVIPACLLLCILDAGDSAVARERWWRALSNHGFFAFDWNCTRTDLISPRLREVARNVVPTDERGQPGMWADRALAVRLRTDRASVLFVPITCGATGN